MGSDEFECLPSGEAQLLLDSELLNRLLDDIERNSIDETVNASAHDHDRRRVAAVKIALVRDFRDQLKTLARGKTKGPKKGNIV